MGDVISMPRRGGVAPGRGTVHVMHREGGGYEIGHESASGGSWGGFDGFDEPLAAVVAAHHLARRQYDGCEVFVPQDVLDALPSDAGPSDKGEW